ncbi:sialate O-acetylesterase [Stieleria sp. TO1_6]|uniref:sialate O-acetylesterase n=1 Tax=Stieleria tagensis TaxID=2956795 RepID=UPI00209B0B12|nr:sialate O-acetylesterase [Stieleria tagensis]MCO8125204.1 sialate O-acetylesterase [Stieleria tagensis]
MYRFLFTLALGLVCPAVLPAALSVPHFFSDHMVLQRDREVALWGSATPGAEVRLQFKGQSRTVKAGSDGRWRLHIASGPASAEGGELVITSGSDRLTIKDVLVGEVWFASGQSNMVFTMNRVPAYADVIAQANFPEIRMFNAPTVTAVEPQDDIGGQWTLCSPDTAPGYSAVAFFFARKLHQELGVPIGVIKSAWGGKPVETFTSREALERLPATAALVKASVAADKAYDPDKADQAFQKRLQQWKTAVDQRSAKPAGQRGRAPRKPAAPKRPLDTEGKPGVLFNSMIHPFVGYAIRGAIWYQGEANAKPGAVPYDKTLPLMIRDWRQRWGNDFSFYYVQLANFRAPSTKPGAADPWALLQDRMRLVLSTTPKTGMAIINDVGEANDIHPKNKQDPGERLARWALAKDYGRLGIYSGPLYQSSGITDGAIRVRFDQAGEGLKSRDGEPLKRFEIAGNDRVWHWAEAKVDGVDHVLVSSPDVPNPLAVRYAWASNPEGANLVNSEGLPASIFRTDAWDDVHVSRD